MIKTRAVHRTRALILQSLRIHTTRANHTQCVSPPPTGYYWSFLFAMGITSTGTVFQKGSGASGLGSSYAADAA